MEKRGDGLYVLGIVFSVLIAVILLFSGVGKIVKAPFAVEMVAGWGLLDYILIIGFIEIVLAVLFIAPLSWVIAGFMLSGFFGGAIVTHLSHGEATLAFIPFMFLIFMWVAMFLRKPGIFSDWD